MYTKAVQTSTDAVGTLQRQQDTYMDSTEAHLQRMNTAWENFQDSLLNSQSINTGADALKGLADIMTTLIDSAGGGIGIFSTLLAILPKVFNRQLATNLEPFIYNIRTAVQNTKQWEASVTNLNSFFEKRGTNTEAANDAIEAKMAYKDVFRLMSIDEKNTLDDRVRSLGLLKDELMVLKQQHAVQEKYLNTLNKQRVTYQQVISQVDKLTTFGNNLAQQGTPSLQFSKNTTQATAEKKSKELTQQFEQMSNFSSGVKDIIPKLPEGTQKEVKAALEVFQEYTNRVHQAQQAYAQFAEDQDGEKLASSKVSLEGLSNAYKNLVGKIFNAKSSIKEITQQLKDLGLTEEQIKQITQALGAELDRTRDRQKIEGINRLTSGLGALAGNMYSVASIGSGDLTQSITSFTVVAANSVPSIMNLVSALKEAKNGITSFSQGLSVIGGVAGGVLAVLGIVIGVVQAFANASQRAKEELIEENKQLIEENNKKLELIQTNEELYKSYEDLEEQYKNHEISQLDLINGTEELVDAYDIEHGELLLLTGQYEELARAIRQKRQEELLDKQATAKEKQITTLENIELNSPYINNRRLRTKLEILPSQIQKQFSEYIPTINTELIGPNPQNTSGAFSADVQDARQVAKIYDILLKIQEEYKKVGLELPESFKNVIEVISENIEDIQSAVQAENEAVTSLIDMTVRLSDVATYDEAIQKAGEFKNAIAQKLKLDPDKDKEEIQEIYDSYADTISNVFVQGADIIANAPEQLQNYLNTLSPKDLAIVGQLTFNSDTTEEDLRHVLELSKEALTQKDLTIDLEIQANLKESGKLSEEDISKLTEQYKISDTDIEQRGIFAQQNLISSLSDTSIKNNIDFLQQVGKDTESATEELEKLLDEQNQTIDKFKAEALFTEEDTPSIYSKSTEEIFNSFEDELKQYNYDFKKLEKAKNQELINYRELNEGKENEPEYKENIQLLEDQLKLIKNLTKEQKDQYTNASQLAKIYDDAIKKVKESLSADDIRTSVFEVMDLQISQLTTKIEGLADSTSLIGEGFIVAAEDVQEFAAQFPELLSQYQVLSDGSLQLNEEVVRQNLNGIKQEVDARYQAQLSQLQQQLELAKVNKEFAQQRVDILNKVLSDEEDASKAQQELTEVQGTYQTKLNSLIGYSQVAAYKEGLSGQEEAFDDTLKNIDVVGQAWAQLGAYASAALAGKDIGEWSREHAGELTRSENISYEDWIAQTGYTDITDKLKDQGYDVNKIFAGLREAQQDLDTYSADVDRIAKQITTLQSSYYATNAAFEKLGQAQDDSNEKTKETLGLLADEIDAYHDVNNEISLLEKSLSRLQKQQEKLLGQDLIDNLNEQLGIIEAQKKATQEKLKIATTEQVALQQSLLQYGVTFDEEGYISNYAAVIKVQQDYMNSQTEAFNALSDEEQEAAREQYDAIQDEYQAFLDMLERYDDLTVNEIQDLLDAQQELIDKQVELQIQKFNMKIDVSLDLKQAKLDWLDFKKEVILDLDEDDILGNIDIAEDKFAEYYNTKNGGILEQDYQHVQAIKKEVEIIRSGGVSSIYGDDINAAVEDLKKYNNQFQTDLKEFKELKDEVNSYILKGLEQSTEAFDKQIEAYDNVHSIAQHDIEIIKLLEGEDAYENIGNYLEIDKQNNLDKLDFIKQEISYWEEQKKQAEEGSEAWIYAQEKMTEATQALNETVEEGLTKNREIFENNINGFFDELEGRFTEGLGLDWVSEMWDLEKEKNAQFLDPIDREYETAILKNSMQSVINDTQSLSAKKRLTTVMQEQLGILEDMDKVSEKDVERAQKVFDIEQAKIALEDAQQNKTKMQLTRDAQGNYSYQFVSDADAVEDARQDLLDAEQALYDFDKERYDAAKEEYLDHFQQFLEKYREISLSDDTEEVKNKKIQQLQEEFQPILLGYEQEYQTSRQNLSQSATDAIRNQELDLGQDIKDINDDVLGTIVPGWNDFTTSVIDDIGGEEGINSVCTEMYTNFQTQNQELMDANDEVAKKAGINLDQIVEGTDPVLEKNQELIEDNDKLIGQYTTLSTKIQTAVNKFNSWITALEDAEQKWFKATQTVSDYITKVKEAYDVTDNGPAPPPEKDWGKDAKGGGLGSVSGSDAGGGGNNVVADSNEGANNNQYIGYSKLNSQGWLDTSSKQNEIRSDHSYVQVDQTPTQHGTYVKYRDIDSGEEFYIEDFIWDKIKNKVDTQLDEDTVLYKENPKYAANKYNPNNSIGVLKENATVIILGAENGYIRVQTLDGQTGLIDEKAIKGFDTGGYTGQWGGEGKLAVLHEKELVLNKQDTSNILAAVNIIRDMQGLIQNLNSFSNRYRASVLETSLQSLKLNDNNQKIDQNVTITANFPNVTQSREIEEAFMNLTNIASQYINTSRFKS